MVPTVQFEANTEVGDALQRLDQQRIDYGVAIDEQGALLMIITREQLRTMKVNERLQTITANRAYPLPIEPDDELDEVVRISADDFSFNQNPLGIVVQKQGSIYGVLLRETIDEQAASLLVGRRLAGKPLKDAPKRIVLQELRGYFGRVILLGVIFPVFIFVVINLALYLEITQGLGVALTIFGKIPLEIKIFLILSGLIAVSVAALLIHDFQYLITRLFEGYWPSVSPFKQLRKWRTQFYSQHWDYLKLLRQSAITKSEENEIMEGLALYPPNYHPDELMPTRFGNILRASEIYAYDRYGIDSSVIWTRLRPLLPQDIITPLEDKMASIDFMLLVAVLAAPFSFFWCIVLAINTRRLDLFLLCSLGWPLAWICYKSAVQAATAFSEQLKAIFDLHRNDLLEKLGYHIPEDVDDQRELWGNLADFFRESFPLPLEPIKSSKLQVLRQKARWFVTSLRRRNGSAL